MPDPNEQLDEAMKQRRLELRMNWREVATAAGISYEALRAIRRGDYKPTELTARALDDALNWTPGSVYAVMAGGEATPTPATTPPAKAEDARAPADLSLSPSEALRRVVRSSARELGVAVDDLADVFEAVRRDLEMEPSTARTDLSDLVREGRRAAGLSLREVASSAADPATGEHVVDADWLDRLERAALDPSEYPEYPQLDALVNVLHLDPERVQEAAGVQFMDVHTVWSDDGEARAVVVGELDAEDLAKVQNLMRLYRKAPRRTDG